MTYADITGVPHADRYLFGMTSWWLSSLSSRPRWCTAARWGTARTRVAIGYGALAIVAAGSATLTTPLSVPRAATVGVAVGLVLLCNIVLGVVTRSAAQRGASEER
ncbi:hypothetical protein [Rhodococcus jostii]|uniref:Uncharacterized protein n=1 Tax=Rhodococcus jostii TaxID=132919 RepID=A0ABU4CLY4_RHOJO|nr:hypothetical protein [Rhodococcus jostii]MDV6284577.1 hypothetical protein [Rhodococcus jostii]